MKAYVAATWLLMAGLFALLFLMQSDAANEAEARRRDYAEFKPERIAGTDVYSVGSTASGRQLYIRNGAISHIVIQPDFGGSGNWEVVLHIGQHMQRYDFPDEATARANVQKFWDFINSEREVQP